MKFIKLREDAILPVRSTKYSAGYDFYSVESVVIPPNEVKIVKTGISFEDMDKDSYLQLSLRSSVSIKLPLLLANGVGIVDSDYCNNEIGIILYNHGNEELTINKNEKLAQGVLLKYQTVTNEEEINNERTGGFGSTNNV